MANLHIRDVDDEVIRALKARADAHRRSLQNELVMILTNAAKVSRTDAAKIADKVRHMLEGREHSDSAVLLREDRKR
mgnify:CR=1 FL=1